MKKLQLFSLIFLVLALTLSNLIARERGERSFDKHKSVKVDLNLDQSRTILTLPFNENFDSGLGLWTVSSMWNIPVSPTTINVLSPDIHPTLVILPEPPGMAYLPMPVSGNGMAWFGEASTGTFLGSNFNTVSQSPLNGGTSDTAQYGWLISPAIDMTMVSNARLSFDTAWEIEGVDANAYDLMYVSISTDGGVTFNTLGTLNPLNDVDGESWKPYSSGGLAQPMVWIDQLFDLTNYVGNTVHLGFYFGTGDELYNGFRGWFIDNISVTDNPLPAPNITMIDPPTSSQFQLVNIIGQNFVNGAMVDVNSTPATTAVFNNTLAQIEVPFLPAGQYDVKLTNPDGQFDVMTNGLTITADLPPDVTSIFPDSAMQGTSVFVQIIGFNFIQGATATIGGVALNNLVWQNSGLIEGNSPSSLPVGTYNVQVTNPDLQFDQLPGAFTVYSSTGINDDFLQNPAGFNLMQNYPNPFNPATKIEFQIPNGSLTKVTVYNLAGQEIATLLNEYRPAGMHSVNFNAENIPSGIYFYQLTTENYSAIKKMILMK